MVWSMRMNYPMHPTALFSSICQARSFELGLKCTSNSARWPHWNQGVAGGCSWEQNAVSDTGCPDPLHWYQKPPLLLFLFQIHQNGSTVCSVCECWGASCHGFHASGLASGFQAALGWAEHNGRAAPLPTRRLPMPRHNLSVSCLPQDYVVTFSMSAPRKPSLVMSTNKSTLHRHDPLRKDITNLIYSFLIALWVREE